MKILIIPGYQDSPKGHWQHWLHQQYKNSEMVVFPHFDNPQKDIWVQTLQDYLYANQDEELLLVAHSMGSVTTAALAEAKGDFSNVVGIILVAPADSEQANFPTEIEGFSPMPTTPLPVPTLLVGSHNDPYMSYERVKQFGNLWDTDFYDAGLVGHINTASGFGPWEGFIPILEGFVQKCLTANIQTVA